MNYSNNDYPNFYNSQNTEGLGITRYNNNNMRYDYDGSNEEFMKEYNRRMEFDRRYEHDRRDEYDKRNDFDMRFPFWWLLFPFLFR